MNYTPDYNYKFVIDTNQYAGNFEREMCAFLTGRVGECGVGKKTAKIFEDEGYEPFENVIKVPDEHGCFRPASIHVCPIPKSNFSSVAIFFEGRPEKSQIELMKSRAEIFSNSKREKDKYGRTLDLRIEGFRLIKVEVKETEEKV